MDFQKLVDSISGMACVISVEKITGDSYGTIRIVTGNKAYIESIESNTLGIHKKTTFVPNSEYQRYLYKDLNFEHFVYNTAVLKHHNHNYITPERYDYWFNMFAIPLDFEDDRFNYCLYTHEVSNEPNAEIMANVSKDTAVRVLNTCIKLHGVKDYNETINSIIKDIREVCKASYCCILTMDFVNKSCALLCEDKAENTGLVTNDNWFDNFYDIAVTWSDILAGSNCLILANEQDMQFVKEKNPIWYESIKAASVESMVVVPLKNERELLGYIWATNFETNRATRIKEILELTSYFVSSDLANRQMFDRLKYLSSIDLLTGIYNRNEMNNRIEDLVDDEEGKPLGVVFADLNGLKYINDSEGHLVGDLMLKNAAMKLQNVFIGSDVFRAGGDEFVVLVDNIEKDSFEDLVSKLDKVIELKENGISFAYGTSYIEDSRNVRQALMDADEDMYKYKQLYYQKENDPRYRPRD
ncbi:MAG: GGDEF domain-containing protein [Lachnospiraceae bacterium]|nr:GGDEF domain-containing protein [Lachnospiraceae bacterium]